MALALPKNCFASGFLAPRMTSLNASEITRCVGLCSALLWMPPVLLLLLLLLLPLLNDSFPFFGAFKVGTERFHRVPTGWFHRVASGFPAGPAEKKRPTRKKR